LSLPHPGSATEAADAFILAGGLSSRMGHDKSLICLNGAPLIQHAIEILRSAGLHPRIAGARSDLSAFAPIIPDEAHQTGLGPLSGICTALCASSTRFVVFLPVDLPLIPASLITYLLHHASITQSAVTAVSVAGFIQAFPAVIDRAAAPALQTSLRSNDRKCLNAFQTAAQTLGRPLSVLPIELLLQAGQISQPNGLPPHAWFHNINSPQDLARAQSLRRCVTPAVFK
jgi:molybdopterin-guanine dinucleotide biosynthesis protein A